jgi:hypothetical protein
VLLLLLVGFLSTWVLPLADATQPLLQQIKDSRRQLSALLLLLVLLLLTYTTSSSSRQQLLRNAAQV